MTTIKSMGSERTLTVKPSALYDGGHHLCIDDPTRRNKTLVITVPTADLAAALGLVTREELDRKQAAWENECGNLEMTQRERDALRADLREADRARDAACDTRDALRAELDEAEATIARVRELLPDMEADIPQDAGNATARHIARKIRAALDPKPTFVLPTEPGARFFATDPNGDPVEFVVYGSGSDYRVFRIVGRWEFHDAGAVMSKFIGHRLIGAES